MLSSFTKEYNRLVSTNYGFIGNKKILCKNCKFLSIYNNNKHCLIYGTKIIDNETSGCCFINKITNESVPMRNYSEVLN